MCKYIFKHLIFNDRFFLAVIDNEDHTSKKHEYFQELSVKMVNKIALSFSHSQTWFWYLYPYNLSLDIEYIYMWWGSFIVDEVWH